MRSVLGEELWNARSECCRCAALHFNNGVLADLSSRRTAPPEMFSSRS